jgi:hypothetical protein
MPMYKLGLVTASFQPITKRHYVLIKEALKSCKKLVIGIENAEAIWDAENPLSYNTRRIVLEELFKTDLDRITFIPLVSINKVATPTINNDNMIGYILNSCKLFERAYPEVWFTTMFVTYQDAIFTLRAFDVEVKTVTDVPEISCSDVRAKIIEKPEDKNSWIDNFPEMTEPTLNKMVIDILLTDSYLNNPTAKEAIDKEFNKFTKRAEKRKTSKAAE